MLLIVTRHKKKWLCFELRLKMITQPNNCLATDCKSKRSLDHVCHTNPISIGYTLMNEDGRECLTRRMKSDLINHSCDIHYQVQQAFDLPANDSIRSRWEIYKLSETIVVGCSRRFKMILLKGSKRLCINWNDILFHEFSCYLSSEANSSPF